jgi:two-component sensor histidine kinase
VRLTVGDEGVGMATEPFSVPRTSLGLQLVHTLTEQIKGTLSVEQRDGTYVTVEFPIED